MDDIILTVGIMIGALAIGLGVRWWTKKNKPWWLD